jgi:hypothetical protein
MPEGNVKKTRVLVPGITAALVMMAAPMLLPGAFAAPTLHGGLNCSLVNDNDLNCTGDVSGLGGATTAEATLTATATVETGCINRGAAEQQPSGLDRETTTTSDTQELNVESGRATFDITLTADTDRDCPDGMKVVITSVTWSDISLEVDPSSGPSRTFTTDEEF